MATRLTLGGLGRKIAAQFELEHGLLRTLVDLGIRPGHMLRGYVSGETRGIYLRPLTLVTVVAAVSSLVYLQFPAGFEAALAAEVSGESAMALLLGLDAQTAQRYLEILGRFSLAVTEKEALFFYIKIPAYALFTWALCRNWKYDLKEHLAVNAHLLGGAAVLNLLVYGLMIAFGSHALSLQTFGNWLVMAYIAWALAQLTGNYSFGTWLRVSVVIMFAELVGLAAVIAVIYWLDPQVVNDVRDLYQEIFSLEPGLG